MKNYFGSVYRYRCILPTNITVVDIDLVNNSNYIRYIQEMKYNTNRFIMFSLHREQESDILDKNDHDNLAQHGNANLNRFPIATQLLSFCILLHIQIRKEIYVFIHFLCVVHGLQIKYLNQDLPNWYTYQSIKTFLSRASLSIQVTDISFTIKPILSDIRDILIGPILSSIDCITLSKVKNYVYEYSSSFIRWILLIFQTFVLQIDEDGEEVLMKIKENDVFRQQKPGKISFLKKSIIYNEDYTFLKFRHLKRKTYFFVRMITLVMLPFIIYRTNQKFHFEPGLPKLAYIVSNLNRQKINDFNDNFWKKLLHKNDFNQSFTSFTTGLNYDESLNLIKSGYCDKKRMVNLWNANQLMTNLDDLKIKASILSIDSFLLKKKISIMLIKFHKISKKKIFLNHFSKKNIMSIYMKIKCLPWFITMLYI